MRQRKLPKYVCPNPDCDLRGVKNTGHIVFHGHFSLKRGTQRRRYKCRTCDKTFCSTTGTPYHRNRCSRKTFDEACQMSVEGMNIAAIARVKEVTWNTIWIWLEKARNACLRFNAEYLRGYELREPQADELKTFIGSKKKDSWVLSLIETSSRLWLSYGVGRRSYKNIRKLFGKAFHRGWSEGRVLITTDGFHPYEWVMTRMFGCACFYGQVIKTWKKNRVTKVEQKIIIGEEWQIQMALKLSEDSEKLNTAFIERLNLTVRRGCSYLQRKTNGPARIPESLSAQLGMQQCYYNFMRPHMSLKFGPELWTPAMVAGIAKRKLSFRQVFESQPRLNSFVAIVFLAEYDHRWDRLAA